MTLRYLIAVCPLLALGCQQPADNSQKLMLAKIDSLQKVVATGYKPGLGEFMTGIQVHHEKLWLAGKYENWTLADFEINEIKEDLDDIKNYCRDRSEIRFLPIIYPALDSMANAIRYKNKSLFSNDFTMLTKACNTCHQATRHEFNVIQVPKRGDFSNQDFLPR